MGENSSRRIQKVKKPHHIWDKVFKNGPNKFVEDSL